MPILLVRTLYLYMQGREGGVKTVEVCTESEGLM